MALKFDKIEPVEFGDLKVMPKMNTELKLRVQGIRTIDAEALDILSQCFEDHNQEVRAFLDQLNLIDIYKLQAYLLGGNSSVEVFMDRFEALMKQQGELDG